MDLPDFGKVSAEYWQNEAVQSSLKAESDRKNAGVAVVTPPVGDALMDGFLAAFNTPVILPVEWPVDVPESHPIRSLGVHVRLWDSEQWLRFWALNKEVKKDGAVDQEATNENLKIQFWYVLWISACDSSGRMIFAAPSAPSAPDDA